jgi:SH3 domain-containing YSC84-like protein 1
MDQESPSVAEYAAGHRALKHFHTGSIPRVGEEWSDMKVKTVLLTLLVGAATIAPALAAKGGARERADKRIRDSAAVLGEILNAGDKGPRPDLIEKAQCVGVIPSLKRAGFIVGAKYGKGIVTCRVPSGTGWSAPEIVRVEGGNIGLQIGAGETDLVFALMNHHAMGRLMADKFTVGGDAAAMAGPVGREATAQTDVTAKAEILSWSRSRGIFAGVTLNGATLSPDRDDNRALYGPNETAHLILEGMETPPATAQPLYAELRAFPPKG